MQKPLFAIIDRHKEDDDDDDKTDSLQERKGKMQNDKNFNNSY